MFFRSLITLIFATTAHAQFAITWSTVEPGGSASGGTFDVVGVAGQPDAGAVMAGGGFALTGGYIVSSDGFAACDSIDFNRDGLYPDTADIDDLLSVFSGGPCSTGTCADTDFNNDGLFPDTADLDSFLSVFSGGACL